MRRSLKFVHTVATATLVGALVLQLLMAWRYTPGVATGDALAIGARQVMVDVSRWVLVPSLVVVVVSGLLLMGLNKTFGSAGWVWIKAMIGLLLVKGVISINDPAARDIAALVSQGAIAANAEALAELARLARMEWLGGWLALVLAIAGIGFGVWRPRFSDPPKRAAATARKADSADAEVLEDVPAR
ncbi:MAG: hypothetical protein U5L03_04675 [Burkholderiaceae bacterium]|nr:hypothetical protein [Burkholderiaceae bacterium]